MANIFCRLSLAFIINRRFVPKIDLVRCASEHTLLWLWLGVLAGVGWPLAGVGSTPSRYFPRCCCCCWWTGVGASCGSELPCGYPSLSKSGQSRGWFQWWTFCKSLSWHYAITLMCLKKNPVLSFGTSRNSLIPSHTFTKSSTVLSFLPILFPNCLPASLLVVYLPYEIVWPYSNSLPYFSQMFNRTLIPP